MSEPQQLIAGIDPGYTGAIAHFAYFPMSKAVRLLSVHDMPTAKAKVGKTEKSHLLMPQLRGLLLHDGIVPPDMAAIEEVGAAPGQGVTSMFRFGYVAGAIAGVCAGLNIPVTLTRPQAWQAIAGVKKGDDAGRLRACELFPHQSDYFARKLDHNRADAALIGYAAACNLAACRVTILK